MALGAKLVITGLVGAITGGGAAVLGSKACRDGLTEYAIAKWEDHKAAAEAAKTVTENAETLAENIEET